MGNTNNTLPSSTTPRGLAAIPLLCAAAAESLEAYLRRNSQTNLETAWWVRQEPLCAPPGSFASFPESLLLSVARFVEHITLTTPGRNLVASFFLATSQVFLGALDAHYFVRDFTSQRLECDSNLVWGSRR